MGWGKTSNIIWYNWITNHIENFVKYSAFLMKIIQGVFMNKGKFIFYTKRIFLTIVLGILITTLTSFLFGTIIDLDTIYLFLLIYWSSVFINWLLEITGIGFWKKIKNKKVKSFIVFFVADIFSMISWKERIEPLLNKLNILNIPINHNILKYKYIIIMFSILIIYLLKNTFTKYCNT